MPAHAQPMAKCGNVVGSPHVVDVVHHLVGFADDSVERHHFVVGAFRAALGARAVVADDVEEQRVLQRADLLELRHEPADLGVGVLGEPGEGFHLALEELLLLRAHVVPRGNLLRTRRELGVSRNHAQLFLPREGFLAKLVPAAAELALVLCDPFLRHVVRGVRRAGGEIHVERLVGRERFLRAHPVDRLVGHVRGEVIARRRGRLHPRHAVEDGRCPLVRLAADESIKLVEARPRRPAIVRPGHRHFPRRRLVIFAERGRAVAVLAENLGERRDRSRTHAGVAGKRRGQLHDRAGVVGVVIVPGQQRDAGWAAQCRGVKAVVLQPAAAPASPASAC